MIRPRQLSEETRKNLRHWAMELVVVVVGVLLALWAQEWVEGQREKRDIDVAEQAVRDEIIYNLAGMEAWASYHQCTEETADFYLDHLRDRNSTWPGYTRNSVSADIGEKDHTINPFSNSLYAMRFLAWQSAQSNGWATRFDPKHLKQYESFYFLFGETDQRIDFFIQTRRSLRPYVYPDALPASDRRALMARLLDISEAGNAFPWLAGFARESRREMKWSAEEQKDFAAKIDGWADIMKRAAPLRDCYDPPSGDLSWKSGK